MIRQPRGIDACVPGKRSRQRATQAQLLWRHPKPRFAIRLHLTPKPVNTDMPARTQGWHDLANQTEPSRRALFRMAGMTVLPTRPLGRTGLNVSILGFGCAPLGDLYELHDDDT